MNDKDSTLDAINIAGILRCCIATWERLYHAGELSKLDEFECDHCDEKLVRDEKGVFVGRVVREAREQQ